MKYSQYKFKFYINATHAIYINGVLGQKHPHTWEVTLNILKRAGGFVPFYTVEAIIEKMMEKYQDKLLNNIEPFITINPTLENICFQFKQMVLEVLLKTDWILLRIEVSETPSRSYIIDLVDEADEDLVIENKHKYAKSIQQEAKKKIDEIIGY